MIGCGIGVIDKKLTDALHVNLPEKAEWMRITYQSFPTVRWDAGENVTLQIRFIHNVFFEFKIGKSVTDLAA